MRKRVWIPLTLLAVAAVGFFGVAPAQVEASNVGLDGKPALPVSARALALHQTLLIVDLHADTLLWRRNLLERSTRGHVDLPRLQAGNVTLQVFASTTKSPRGLNYDGNTDATDNITPLVIAQLQPVQTWFSLLERSLFHARKLDRAVAGSRGQLIKVSDAAGLDGLVQARSTWRNNPDFQAPHLNPATNPAPVGAMLSIEGLHNLEGKAENLDKLHAAGFRMASLTHFFDNQLAGSMHGVKKGGLTPQGRAVVRAMEDKGMILDVAHLSHTGVAEVLAMARRPVVSSHGGVQATCQTNRNLSDEEIRGIAKTGGVIGIGYWDGAVCDIDPRSIARAMKHVRDVGGIDAVALGSDFDGGTITRFDTAGLAQITQALMDEGFSEDEVRKAMGLNALRAIRQGILPLGGTRRGREALAGPAKLVERHPR